MPDSVRPVQGERAIFRPAGAELAPLPPDQFRRVSADLEERPETAASLHLLERGICRVFESPDALVVQADPYPEEPFAYGSAEGISTLLRGIAGWNCVNVAEELAAPIQRRLAEVKTHVLGDLYLTTDAHPACARTPEIRQLTLEDERLISYAPAEIQGGGYESAAAMLRDGYAAGAIVGDELVAIAHVSVLTRRYGELGVATLERWRRRGFATGAAAAVVSWILDGGRTAVWSCGEHNAASLTCAKKLGFRPAGRRAYVVLSG